MIEPLPQKHLPDRTIYLSRNQFGLEVGEFGRPIITDFGLAVKGSRMHNHLIQPDEYRAPEVIIGAGWGYSTDIWNLAVLVCLMLCQEFCKLTYTMKLVVGLSTRKWTL